MTRLVSAGTLLEEGSLEEKAPRWCMAAFPEGESWGLAWADLSTGEFRVAEVATDALGDRLARLDAAECLLPESRSPALEDHLRGGGIGDTVFTPAPDFSFGRETATDTLLSHFGVRTLDGPSSCCPRWLPIGFLLPSTKMPSVWAGSLSLVGLVVGQRPSSHGFGTSGQEFFAAFQGGLYYC